MKAVLLLFTAMACLAAGPAQEFVAQGNAYARSGNYTEAIRAYEKALSLRPDSPEALYDLGTALYRKGEIGRALEKFERAALLSRRGSTAVLSNYNAGNSAFQVGLTLVYSDPRGALSMLERAIETYREALRLDPNLKDATYNLEVVRKWLRLLERQFALQGNAAPVPGPPLPGAGVGVVPSDIFKQDARNRSGASATARPPAVERDW